MHRAMLTVAMATGMLAGCGHAPLVASSRGAGPLTLADAMPDQIIVKPRAGKALPLSRLAARLVATIPGVGAQVLQASDVPAALTALQGDPAVAWAEPNYVMHAPQRKTVAAPGPSVPRIDDELLPKQWGMAKIGAPQAWGLATGKGVRVALVDTGIDYRHPEFGGRVDHGRDFTGTGTDGMDALFHGTHCAGTLGAGRGNGGIVGVAPEVSLIPLKVIGPNGAGSYATVATGITYAADLGVTAISISLAGRKPSQALADAVAYAVGKGALVVAAMGNEGGTDPDYPAACPGVMAVGATDDNDTLPNFTNCGPHLSVVAPGVEILSTMPDDGYDTFDGTSAAAPYVTGIAALLKQLHPTWTAAQLRARIEATADDRGLPGYDIYFGHGRVNAARAVAGN